MKLFSGIILLLSNLYFAQAQNIITPQKIENSFHKNHLNKIVFLEKSVLLEYITESDLVSTMIFQEDKDLDIRVFQDNSLVNYLHQLNPSLTAEELLKKGNYQFTFYVDGKIIYVENLNSGAGTTESKTLKTTFRIPLMSSKNEDSWGKFLWSRFYLTNNGIDVLNEGKHILKIEIRPYLKTPTVKTGNIIAQGEVNLIVQNKNIPEEKIKVQNIKPNSGWKVSNELYDTKKIRTLNQKIAENRFREITSIVVIKNGELLLEEYFNNYNRDSLNDTRSVGKSFASALMGIAIKDGYLQSENQKISEFYDLKTFKNYSSQKENVTIKSLLTMSSGFEGNDQDEESPGNEENMYPTDNWIKFTLDLPMTENKIGETWNYFTAGVVLSGDILDKSVPKGLKNYADKKLFQPLGITNYNWQFTPHQKPSLAGGLKMNTLDLAKFGQLYKNNGVWNGKTILNKDWIKKSFTNYFSNTPDFEGYGYLFWRKVYTIGNKSFETYQSSGNGGNKIIMFSELPIVMVITAKAYNQPYSHSQVDKIVQEYLLPAVL
ncbi:serine hydrolase domain-containing protein [Chryseobacterium balustinum]|uniref:Beta-lactamase n=1 Tax=Chryseobacterium balustinum TaxID=246 RepID=A0AAX2IQQ1_9FLAO|nr:serine hydrolase [Chryseobacterium balustinum]AZB28200.1 class C beta-lactamase-related serine hydrolase [Chryseobacterium balustinum]SKC12857.1 CubicO group peptidase, beta-lactamase class C family [Chryseobacterium balustinum]SQA92375.1 Beta-lactamase [Chryseobacterium balustinum]